MQLVKSMTWFPLHKRQSEDAENGGINVETYFINGLIAVAE
jgi:hypothetical protein